MSAFMHNELLDFLLLPHTLKGEKKINYTLLGLGANN
jgi:hypothetical protein